MHSFRQSNILKRILLCETCYLQTGNMVFRGIGSFVMSYFRWSDFLQCSMMRGIKLQPKSC